MNTNKLEERNFRFIHIPKTGGSTLKLNFISNKENFSMDHLTCFKEGDKHITILRNPIDQVNSRYRSQTETTNEPFKVWFENEQTHNMQAKHLALRVLKKDSTFKYLYQVTEEEVNELIKALNKFYKVLITEDLKKEMPKLLKRMRIPLKEKHCNISKKKYKLTKEEEDLVKEKCSLDFKLYNSFKNGKSINRRRTRSI